MQQTRRQFLATLGLSSAAALAGCTRQSGAPAPETSPQTTTTTTTTPAFSGCPSLREHADETVCAATAADDSPVVLRPSATELSGSGTLQFTLRNGRETSIGLNPYDWAVHRKTESGWAKVAPDMVIQPWHEIPPGEAQSWVLRVGERAETTTTNDSTTASNTTTTTSNTTTATASKDPIECGPLPLTPGTYAFSVVAAESGTRTAYVARFRVA
ncbi:hypothetical protein [Halarchaeum sp. P4]|uniref:hypothetical protein n=1 Tax=Halarchaeum sp. P4 TaxID=3421639 RepID=UPI003EBFFAE4